MKIKKGILAAILVLALCSAGVCAASMIEYEIADLDLSLALPAEYHYVFTRDMDGDDSDFVDLGMTKEFLFENKSLYLVAFTEDQNAEIIVSMTATDWSRLYYDFNELEDSDLMEMAQVCLMDTDSAANMEITDCDVFEGNTQAKFLKANGLCAKDGNDGYAVQYVTVLNGNAYTITFNFDHRKLSDEEIALTEEVVSSAVFHTVETKDTGNSNVVYIAIIVTMAVIIGILLLVIYKKHYTINGYRRSAAANSISLTEHKTTAEEKPVEPPSTSEETGHAEDSVDSEGSEDKES